MKYANIFTKKIKIFFILNEFCKNLGNNDIFSKVFGDGLRYYMILENYPEYLQKNGYFFANMIRFCENFCKIIGIL